MYQPTYDAVLTAAREAFDMSNVVCSAIDNICVTQREMTRPSVLYRPDLHKDGNSWIALYGPDLAIGVVGTGDTPEEAMRDFDKNWFNN